jgi:anti-sigma B factor antagonist
VGSLAQDTYSPTHSLPAPRVQPTRRSEYGLVEATRGSPLVRVVEVAGSVDLLTAPGLAEQLTVALADGTPLVVVVDLRQVDFLAAAGLSVLVAADWHARQQHTTLRLVVATHAVRRVLSVTGLDQTLTVYPLLEPALAV